MSLSDHGFAAKVSLFREEELYVPAIQVHRYNCQGPKGCCDFEYRKCYHLASLELPKAIESAKALAIRIGVPCDVT